MRWSATRRAVRRRLFPLLQSGFAYFWRFVRITLVTLVIAGPTLAGLNALENLWTAHVDKTMVGRPGFLLGLAGVIVVLLVAALLRVYFDLMQVYTVQLGACSSRKWAEGRQRQIRQAFKPAWKALFSNFFRTYLTFVLLTAAGICRGLDYRPRGHALRWHSRGCGRCSCWLRSDFSIIVVDAVLAARGGDGAGTGQSDCNRSGGCAGAERCEVAAQEAASDGAEEFSI